MDYMILEPDSWEGNEWRLITCSLDLREKCSRALNFDGGGYPRNAHKGDFAKKFCKESEAKCLHLLLSLEIFSES